MKLFIAGATGVLGRRLIPQFRERGHSVACLSRSPKNDATIRSFDGEARQADLFNADSLARAAEGADVIIHAATSIPSGQKPRREDWKMNDAIRVQGTRALAEAAARVRAKLFLVQSIVWVVRPHDMAPFHEDSPYNSDPVIQSAVEMEKISLAAGQQHGFDVAILRGGWFHSADASHTRTFGRALAARKLPVIGKGDAIWPMIHVDDFASAFVAAAVAGRPGVWHITDNEPAASGEYLRAFAKKIGAPEPRSVPAWLARLAVGSDAVKFLTASTRTSNERFRRDFGWTPRYPTYREALDEIVSSWRRENFLELGNKIAA